MKKTILLLALFAFNISFAQKAKVKSIKLPVKGKNHDVSVAYANDVLYFTKLDLIQYMEKKDKAAKTNVYAENIRYLKAYGKDIEMKVADSLFSNVAERNLHKTLVSIGPALLAAGKAADMNKATKIFVDFIVNEPCAGSKDKFKVSEKAGRVIFDCQ